MSNSVNVGIIGLGTVGRQVYTLLSSNSEYLKSKLGYKVKVKKICDRFPENIPSELENKSIFTKDAEELLSDPEMDIVVELIGGLDPAEYYIKKALKEGKNVVTANKALLAEKLDLLELADEKGKSLKFEGSVGGGIPVIRTIQKNLVVDEVQNLYGIVNGTSNYILTNMEEDKCDFKKALEEAKQRGYAEQDPSFDVDGIDSVHKLTILANLCFGMKLKPENIFYEGISNIDYSDIRYASESGYKIKLLAIAKRNSNKLELRVHPTLIEDGHLLASVRGVYNAMYLECKLAGKSLLFGEGAGGPPAGNAVVSDIIDIASFIVHGEKKIKEHNIGEKPKLEIRSIEDIWTRYYIRFMAIDKPGVLAKISDILGSHQISISSVIQKERKESAIVPIVMMTHEAQESDLQKAINEIKVLHAIKDKPVVIRVEDKERT